MHYIKILFLISFASPLFAETVQVSSFGRNYLIDLTDEFCHDPSHPVSIERRRLQSTVKEPLLVFLKCSDKYSGIEGLISRYSKKISGNNWKHQRSINNDFLSGYGIIEDANDFQNKAAEFPDNEFLNNLNSKLREKLAIDDWSVNEQKILSVGADHIIMATKVSRQSNYKTMTGLVMSSFSAKVPSILFIYIRLGDVELNDGQVERYSEILKKITASIFSPN